MCPLLDGECHGTTKTCRRSGWSASGRNVIMITILQHMLVSLHAVYPAFIIAFCLFFFAPQPLALGSSGRW